MDWLARCAHRIALEAAIPEPAATYVAERLASLYLERLPGHLAQPMLDLLQTPARFAHCLTREGDPSIGYIQFVDRAFQALSLTIETEWNTERSAYDASDSFLRQLAEDTPEEIVDRIREVLPFELKDRMITRFKSGKTAA